SCWVARCMRRLNCAFSRLSSSACSSAASLVRSSLAFMVVSLGADATRHEGRGDRQLGGGQAEGLAREFLADALHLVEHLAGLDLGDPVLRIALALAHTDFGRFLRNGLVREDADPDTAAALDVAVDGTTRGLDLAGGQTATTGGLQTELAEGDLNAARSQAGIAAFLLFAVFPARG